MPFILLMSGIFVTHPIRTTKPTALYAMLWRTHACCVPAIPHTYIYKFYIHHIILCIVYWGIKSRCSVLFRLKWFVWHAFVLLLAKWPNKRLCEWICSVNEFACWPMFANCDGILTDNQVSHFILYVKCNCCISWIGACACAFSHIK